MRCGAIVVGVVCGFVAASCSSGTTGGSGAPDGATGSSGGVTQATPQIVLMATLAAGAGGAAKCPDAGKSLVIGAFDPAQPVKDGDSFSGSVVSVGCRVVATAGRGFDTSATARLGESGGTLTYSGTTDASGNANAASILLVLQGQSYASRGCLMKPASATGGIGVASGRYWADFTCPGAENATADRSCDLTGTLRVENCTQQ